MSDIAYASHRTDAHFEMSSAVCHLVISGLMPSGYTDNPVVYLNKASFVANKGIDGMRLFSNDKVFLSSYNSKNYLFVASGVTQNAANDLRYTTTMNDDVLAALQAKIDLRTIVDPAAPANPRYAYCDAARLNAVITKNAVKTIEILLKDAGGDMKFKSLVANTPVTSYHYADFSLTDPISHYLTSLVSCSRTADDYCACVMHRDGNAAVQNLLLVDTSSSIVADIITKDTGMLPIVKAAYVLD